MIGTNPDLYSANVKLTAEQEQQLEVFQTRLATIQNEIKIAGKYLVSLQNDSVRIAKEKEYEENLLRETKTALALTEDSFTKKNEALRALEQEIVAHTDSIAAFHAEHQKKLEALNEKERLVNEQELQHKEKHSIFNLAYQGFKEEERAFNEKVAALKELIVTF